MMGWLLPAVVSFLFLMVLFRPLELLFPAKPDQTFFRPHWWTDLCFFLGQYLIWSFVVLWGLESTRSWVTARVPIAFHEWVASQPFWLQILEVVFISDLAVYWGHRMQHRFEWLWRFHSVHHSAEHLDWLAAHREHPLDTVYTMTILNLPVFVLGFPLATIAGLYAFRGLWAIYIHSNVRFPLGPLRMLIGAPELHHWHHHPSRDSGNYANVSPLMDLLFGTYRCPDHEPELVGLAGAEPKNYVRHMIDPILPKKSTV